MKFKIRKELLMACLNKVSGVASTKSLIPILTGILIKVDKTGITLIGSNGDITVKALINVVEDESTLIEDIEAGSIVVQAKIFAEIVKKLPNKDITVTCNEDSKILIESGKSKFNLNGQSGEEFPVLPTLKDVNGFQMAAASLKSVIKRTVFSAATSETRPILTGVNLQKVDDHIKFTATDSHRLSQLMEKVNDLSDIESTTIPAKTLVELNKVLPDTEENIEVSIGTNIVAFESRNMVFFSRIIDGNFPETSRLIPDTTKTSVIVTKKELLDTIERASLLSKDKGSNVIKLSIGGGLMAEISSNSPEIGNVSEDVVMTNFEGEEITLSFSASYAMDSLKATNSEEVTLTFNGPMRPFIITEDIDSKDLQLILPVRTY